jgi:hypothetical protein
VHFLQTTGQKAGASSRRLPAFDLHTRPALALTGWATLADKRSLLQLGERAGDLANGDLHRVIRVGQVVPVDIINARAG